MRTEPLARKHDRASFSCGVPALDDYLKTYALQNAKNHSAATFVLLADDSRTIHGFYSLTSRHVLLDELPDEIRPRLPKYPEVGATLIGRLAVNIAYQGQGIGRLLVMDALDRCIRAAAEVASALILVDAKDPGAAEFYLACGFTSFKGIPDRLFITTRQAAEILKQAGAP